MHLIPGGYAAHQVPVPTTPLLTDALPRVDWSDAYAVSCDDHASRDPQQWVDATFHSPPPWGGVLFGLRELLVGVVGIERAGGSAFNAVRRTDAEVLLGIDQSHLSFRASMLCRPGLVVLTSVVQVHDRRGRAYSALVRRVHPLVVRAMLSRAAERLDARAGVAAGRP
jgi:hypothetical protein